MARAKAIFFGTGVACLLAIACAEGSTLEQELNQNGSGGTDLNPNPGDGTAATGTGGNGNTAGAGNTAGDGNTAGGGNTGGGGNTDTCNPQWANQMGEASCDSCLLSSCCETLAECDYGTPCELLGQCIEVNCAAATDFEACANEFCPTYMTTPALDAWNARAGCAGGTCASSCSGAGGGGGGGSTSCNVTNPSQTGNATCDTCLGEQCCSTLQNCDAGTECGFLQACADSFCTGAADFQVCLETSCSTMLTSGAVAAWNARSDCMNGTCLSACQ